jgi:hypothetical protein
MQLSSGHHLRYLTPAIDWQYENSLLYDPANEDYSRGINRLTSSITFGDNVRSAYRNMRPRWGYTLRVNHTFNPTNSYFAHSIALFGQALTPAIGRNHSLRLRAAFQANQKGKMFTFSQRDLYPRGADYTLEVSPSRYVATAVDYQLPLCYPDFGIPSVIFFKRIALNVGFNYATMRTFDSEMKRYNWHNVNSFGGDLILDFNLIRTPAPATFTLNLSLYKPSNRKGVHFSAGVGLPI